MLLLSLLASLPLQDDIIGWSCTARRAAGDRIYQVRQSVEGAHRFEPQVTISWRSGPSGDESSVRWLGARRPGQLPGILLTVPLARRASNTVLRIVFADGTGQVIREDMAWWRVERRWRASTGVGTFESPDGPFNRRLWAARAFRLIAEDRRGRPLGALDVSLPDLAEADRIAAELGREVAARLDDPASPASRCSSYGQEAYLDPA